MQSVRPEVLGFEPYTPGLSIEEIKARYGLSRVIKLASNENPLGASPLVQRVLRDRAGLAFRYPQAGSPRLVEALSRHLGVPASTIVAGNGSDEIIDLLIRVKARPGQDHVVAFRPCFSIYDVQSRLCGVEMRRIPVEPDFSLPLGAVMDHVDESTAMVFVTSPDNPSGYAATADELACLAGVLPQGTLLVVDEAYIDFARSMDEHTILPRLAALDNVAVLRTFSKAYGLAGLRLGYGIMPAWLADLVQRVKLPFSVNLLAEEAGIAALEDEVFYRATVDTTLAGRDYRAAELGRLGCLVRPSQANFLMFEPPASGLTAQAVFERLLRRGVIIRPLKSYGLPGFLRVSVGSMEENRELVHKLEGILAHG
jgi:histidinol-phosphate aminotransferase